MYAIFRRRSKQVTNNKTLGFLVRKLFMNGLIHINTYKHVTH